LRSLPSRLGWVPVLYLAFGLTALAATGELKGKVVDRSGTPLPGVTVVARNDSLGVSEQGGVTNAQGDYRIIALPPGTGYKLRATLPTYAPLEFSDLEVPEGASRIQNIVLQPASELKETVRVEAKGEVVNTESVTTSTTFSSEFISGLPVLGRDYQDILSLAPGVTDVNDTGNPNIHGARDTDVLTLVDGLNTTDPFSGYYGQQMNIESIQEIEVITSGSRAEFSRAQGGFVNILTKSGSNEFQGAFKFYMRSSRLDQDGAGTDDPELAGGLGEASDFRDQSFTDLYPFFSLSGAFVKDKLWYTFSAEYVQVETPVNSLTQSFVVGTRGYRVIGKTTWQISSANKLAFSVNVDRTQDENQGLTSLTNEESGYSFKRGGPTYALRETAVLGPSIFLESALGWFDNNFQRSPTLNPDTNQNGILSVDDRSDLGGNGDSIIQASEYDPGEDYDSDQRYDIFEDQNGNGLLDNIYEDRDFDGRLTLPTQCEGASHEDRNCNGTLDFEEDKNLDGVLQSSEDVGIPCADPVLCPSGTLSGTRGNGRFDTEDANGSGALDVVGTAGNTPFPYWVDANQNGWPDPGEFRAPLPADRIYFRDTSGRFSGPNPYEYDDHRTRLTLREDLSFFVSDFGGTHDLKLGGIYEKEGYDSTTIQRPYLRVPRARTASSLVNSNETTPGALVGFLGVPGEVNNSAEGKNYGFFIQDTYKPLPNLTLGLGLRVDIEDLSSAGYSFFEPAAQREHYTALVEISGVDVSPNGITTTGLCRDPLYNCVPPTYPLHVASIYQNLLTQAPQYFTRHNSEVDILGPFLAGLLGNAADINDLQGYNVRQPEDIEIQNTNVAPRLSLTWDPWADGKSKAFASWGRYYDKLFLNSMTLEQGPDSVTRFYNFDKDGVDNAGQPDNHFGAIISQSPPSAYQIDRSLSTPYSDEMTLGFQRELAPEISLGITYIRRDYQNQLQDVDVNHYTVRDPVTGRLVDQLGEELISTALGKKVNGARQPDGVPDLYIQNFFFNRVFRLGNYNNQTYRGVELELVKRLSRKWQMEASYTYSRSQGDAESFLSDNGDDPTLTEFEPGYLDYDQTHVVKLNAIAFLPSDWRLGGTILYASGLPYSFIQETESSDDAGYVQSRRLFGYYHEGFIAENRNIHRNPASYEINVRTEKAFVIGKAAASAFFEIFNLLNTDDLRLRTVDTGVTRLNNVGERQFGRRFAFGIQINF